MDAEQLAFPLLDQMRWTDNQNNLIGSHLFRDFMHCAGCNRYRGSAAHRGLSGAHHPAEQDTIALLKAFGDGCDDVLLRGVQRILALQPDAIQPA